MNKINEKRIIKVNFNKNGNGYFINRVAIPPKWVSHLGITENDTQAIIEIKDDVITIKKA